MAAGTCAAGPTSKATNDDTASTDTAQQRTITRGHRAEAALELYDLIDGLRDELGCSASMAASEPPDLASLRAMLQEAMLSLECIQAAHHRLAASLAGHAGSEAMVRTRVIRSLGHQADALWRAHGHQPPGNPTRNTL